MSEAPRVIFIAFIGERCAGTFVSVEAAQDATRERLRPAYRTVNGAKVYLIWSSRIDKPGEPATWTLHVSDECTHREAIARIEMHTLERRQPGERRLRS